MELIECINFLLTNAQHTVFKLLKQELDSFDVTPVQYSVLKCLWDEDSQSPKQISETINLDSSTITGILDRLESKKLIRRVSNKDDRRALTIILTDNGKMLQEPIEAVIDNVNESVLKTLTKEEQKQLKQYLKLIANLKEIN